MRKPKEATGARAPETGWGRNGLGIGARPRSRPLPREGIGKRALGNERGQRCAGNGSRAALAEDFGPARASLGGGLRFAAVRALIGSGTTEVPGFGPAGVRRRRRGGRASARGPGVATARRQWPLVNAACSHDAVTGDRLVTRGRLRRAERCGEGSPERRDGFGRARRQGRATVCIGTADLELPRGSEAPETQRTPMWASGMQQARGPRSGGSRQGGERPRSRNGTGWLAPAGRRAPHPRHPGVDGARSTQEGVEATPGEAPRRQSRWREVRTRPMPTGRAVP